jgi:pimeloyl-ACP methyl ester carboxylesterase
MVITAVADRLKDRIHRLVYLDAAVPGDGDDFASQAPGTDIATAERRRAAFRSMAPDGQWLPPGDLQSVGVKDPADADWLRRRLTPHPLRTWLEPVRFTDGGHAGLRKTYVLVTDPPTTIMGYPLHAEVARRGGEWTYREIATGHNLMVTEPVQTADLLIEAAS